MKKRASHAPLMYERLTGSVFFCSDFIIRFLTGKSGNDYKESKF